MIGSDGKLVNPEARIENSSRCNASCLYCPREQMTRPKMDMPLEHFQNLVIQVKRLGAKMISVFGYGEPLIDPTFEDKIIFCSSEGLHTFTTTNASFLTVNIAWDLIDAGLRDIRFSVHGMTKEKYERIHKGLNYGKVKNNILNFIEVNSMERFPVTTHITSIIQNGEDPQKVADYWLKKGVDYVEVWKPHNWAYGRDFRPLTLERKKTCGRPFSGPIQINADGKIMVCCFDTDAKMTIGDTHKTSIYEILNGSILREIQERHLAGQLSGLPCETCDQLNIGDEPLLFSNRDEDREIGRTSTYKFPLG